MKIQAEEAREIKQQSIYVLCYEGFQDNLMRNIRLQLRNEDKIFQYISCTPFQKLY